ncbi:MAG: hypothetical protein ACTSRP_16595 [Candidatus Helarchaeota archaeon]
MTEEKVNSRTISEYFKIIQSIIDRMGRNSFMIKAWYATLFSAVIVLIFTYKSFTYEILIINIFLFIISIVFWIIDSYYLKKERLFRKLYEKKVEEYNDDKKRQTMKIFDLSIKAINKETKKFIWIIFSKTEFSFYIIFIAMIVFLSGFLCFQINY